MHFGGSYGMFLLVYQKAFFAFSIQSSSLMTPISLSLSLSLHPSWSIPGASLQQAACAQEAVFPMGLQVKNQDSLSACEGRHLSPQLRLWGPSPHHPPLPHPRPSPSLHPSILTPSLPHLMPAQQGTLPWNAIPLFTPLLI